MKEGKEKKREKKVKERWEVFVYFGMVDVCSSERVGRN